MKFANKRSWLCYRYGFCKVVDNRFEKLLTITTVSLQNYKNDICEIMRMKFAKWVQQPIVKCYHLVKWKVTCLDREVQISQFYQY